MNDNFKEGSWVFYINPSHMYHLSMFQIQKIVPMRFDPITGVVVQEQGYNLVYGSRDVFAKLEQLLHRGDPKVQNLVLGNRAIPEDKALFLNSDGSVAGVITNIGKFSHTGHEVIENFAGGKSFKYCRNCKVEVNE